MFNGNPNEFLMVLTFTVFHSLVQHLQHLSNHPILQTPGHCSCLKIVTKPSAEVLREMICALGRPRAERRWVRAGRLRRIHSEVDWRRVGGLYGEEGGAEGYWKGQGVGLEGVEGAAVLRAERGWERRAVEI